MRFKAYAEDLWRPGVGDGLGGGGGGGEVLSYNSDREVMRPNF